MRHRHFKISNMLPNYASQNYKIASARARYTHVWLQVRTYKVSYPEGAAAAEMATATADDIYIYRIQYCIRGYHVLFSWAGQHARSLRCGGVGGGYMLCGYLSVFRARHGYDQLWILWHALIVRHKS